MTVDHDALLASLDHVAGMLEEIKGITRGGMEEQYSELGAAAGDRWLDALAHLHQAHAQVEMTAAFLRPQVPPGAVPPAIVNPVPAPGLIERSRRPAALRKRGRT